MANSLQWFDSLFRKIGIDLGTTRTRLWVDGQIVIDEPSCIAVDTHSQRVLAVGRDARAMRGRVGGDVQIYFPLAEGQVQQAEVAEALIKVLLQRVIKNAYFLRPIVMVSLPAGAEVVVREAVSQLIYNAGAREVYTIAQPLAAAIGAGVPIADTSGSFVVHAGGGVIEGAVITLGSLVKWQQHTQAGLWADQAIVQAVQQEAQLQLSVGVAEKLKRKLGSVGGRAGEALVSGQDVITGAPKEITINSTLLQQALLPVAQQTTKMMQELLSQLPPELMADVIDKGILLSGGLASLHGLDTYLVQTLGVPVASVEEPDLVVIKGIGTALQHLNLFKESLGYQL